MIRTHDITLIFMIVSHARKTTTKSTKGFFMSYDAPAPRRKFW